MTSLDLTLPSNQSFNNLSKINDPIIILNTMINYETNLYNETFHQKKKKNLHIWFGCSHLAYLSKLSLTNTRSRIGVTRVTRLCCVVYCNSNIAHGTLMVFLFSITAKIFEVSFCAPGIK